MNVQGLSHIKWNVVAGLIDDDVFDYLFVLETWYVEHAVRRRDPRVIATTDVPSPLSTSGHPPGGITLLGTPRARGWLKGEAVSRGQEAISVVTCRGRLTGVYLPPSLSPEKVEATLDSIADSDVVMGDVNVRFSGLPLQHGSPGPLRRLEMFRRWLGANPFAHVMPSECKPLIAGSMCETMLNLDHCFVRDSLRSHTLHLPTTRGLGVTSDHRYALSLNLHGAEEEAKGALRLPRYHIRLLDDEARVNAVRRSWTRHFGHCRDLLRTAPDIDQRNAQVVKMCQHISETMLGRRRDTRRSRRANDGSLASPQSQPSDDDSGIMGSIRLYKRAARVSQENAPLMPTENGRMRGVSAIKEVAGGLARRFTSQSAAPSQSSCPQVNILDYISAEEIAEELRHQDSSKACGMDGIHIRLMQALSSTSFVHVLAALYNSCIKYARTPRAWNDTMVCLLAKDHNRPKDADNVRPITLICMFRKVFERLLLRRFDTNGWASLQPTQAGFRSHYSTCINAGIVHALLESQKVTHVAFLDFKAAFDVVDHALLMDVLSRRGCPPQMRFLVAGLTFHNVRSRVVSDGEASDWFPRSRGVLQGSPLSPYLFNIFVDALLEELNRGANLTPRSLFYADDGTLLATSSAEIQCLLNIVASWSARNRMTLNVKKCGYIAPSGSREPVCLGGDRVPQVEEYSYLGFPMTGAGVNFAKHLTKRLEQACGRADFLSLHSDRWGPAHRLRIYRQYLAPMFEYGAPLVAAYAERCSQIWQSTSEAIKKLTGWIAGYTANSHLTRNLLGLQSLPDRFAALKTSFQVIIRHCPNQSPLKVLRGLCWQSTSFYERLTDDQAFKEFLDSHRDVPVEQAKFIHSIRSFLRSRQDDALAREARRRKLTRLIPSSSRLKRDMRGADRVLRAPRLYQKQFLQYRRGTYNSCRKCVCDKDSVFLRGHETCCRPDGVSWLSSKELRIKARVEAALGPKLRLTDVDFLLNTGHFRRAHDILAHITKTLAEANSPT